MDRCMTSSLTTMYFGHQISIEPVEWGFLASVAEPRSGVRIIAVGKSVMQALDSAFDVVDDRLRQPQSRSHERFSTS
jgi:hypothetical protein